MKPGAYFTITLILALASSAQTPATPERPEQQVFQLLLDAREKAGVPAVQWDDHLAEAARFHAKIMADHQDLSHQFKNEPQLLLRIAATGARFTVAAENIGSVGFAEDAHLGWMLSPGHRANILNPTYTHVGIGVVKRDRQLYIVEDFAHVLPSYSENEFRDIVVASFNRTRESKGLRLVTVTPDEAIRGSACSAEGDVRKVSSTLVGRSVKVFLFSLSDPDSLPEQARDAINDAGPHGVHLDVCYRPDEKYGFANFWVVLVVPS